MSELTQSRDQIMARRLATCDGNEAVASVVYRLNEVIAIFPITPASPMGEWADTWATTEQPNIWGTAPSVVECRAKAALREPCTGPYRPGR